MTLNGFTLQSLRAAKLLKAFVVWLCSLSILLPAAPAFAAATVATTTTLATSVTTVAVGTPVTLTATVAAASGTGPTGTVTFKKGTTTLGTATLTGTGTSRTATFSTTFTTVASNSLTAVYAGDATYMTSTSAAKTVSSTKTTPTNVVTSSANPSITGNSVTFTSTVTGYNPTGTVTFKDGTTTLGTGTLAGTGNTRTATYSTSALSVATHSITAVYAGDTLNNTKTSAALSQVVNNKTTPTIGLASSANPSTSGGAVTFTATVTGTTPTGTVTFKDGTTTLGTGTLAGSGDTMTATYATSTLTVGTHSITAVYAGDTKNNTVTSSAVSQVVNNAVTTATATLASSANPSSYSASVTFTATVTGTNPTGTVTFKDGATTLGTGTLSGTGNSRTATFATSTLSVGSHAVTAEYGGDAGNTTATSSAVSQVVNVASSTTALSSSANPSNLGSSVTFTATITGASPTGTVTFKDGANTLGTGTISSGVATFATSSLSVGSHSVTATYAGDANNAASTSTALSQVVNTAATTTTMTSNANPGWTQDMITFTATVTGSNPTGTVVFYEGPTYLGSGTLSAGVATFGTTTLGAGTHSITATYQGDANNASSVSTAFGQVVNAKTQSTVVVSSNIGVTSPGQSIVFTATVTGSNPTGTVTFKDLNYDTMGTTTLGTASLSAGVGSISVVLPFYGQNNVFAEYSGDAANLSATSSHLMVTANPPETTTVVSTSVASGSYAVGSPITLIATVNGANPTGTVTFRDRGDTQRVLGTSSLVNGVATLETTLPFDGTRNHTISVSYSGDANNKWSNGGIDFVVTPLANLTFALSTSPVYVNSNLGVNVWINTDYLSGYGQTITLKDGDTVIGTSPVTLSSSTSGYASFNMNVSSVGVRHLTATYSGDPYNAANTVAQDVNVVAIPVVAPTISITSSANPSPANSAVQFTVDVVSNTMINGESMGITSGTVTLLDGTTPLGTVDVASGVPVFSVTLGVGTHNITASFSGDAAAGASAGTSAVFVQTITAPAAVLVNPPMSVQYGYDANGNLTQVVDPYGRNAMSYYDAKNRLIQTQRPDGSNQSIQSFAYDAADNLTLYSDPRNVSTSFSPNGFGDTVSQNSPDTGVTSFTYDANGNVLTRTDANGKVRTFTYDNLNRLTNVHYATGADTVLEYDGGAAPYAGSIGKLTKVTDSSGNLTYQFDSAGRLVSKTQVTNGKTFVVGYTWGDSGSALDKVTAITYPSGSKVNYSYNATGEVSGVTVSAVNANGVGVSGTATNLISGITTNPAGQVLGWSWSSGKTQTFTYDQYGQLKSYKLGDDLVGGEVRTIGYDGAGKITSYTHTQNGAAAAGLDQSFTYDDLGRLVAANIGSNSTQYSYDATSNRTSKIVNGVTYTNTISSTSNRQVNVQDVGGTFTVTYDNAGNVTSDGVNSFTYNDRNRMASVVTAGGTVNYTYNALDLRVMKSGAQVPTGAAYYVYDEAGKIIGEYDANGVPVYETIYLGMAPVGLIKTTGSAANNNLAVNVYNVYSDHLATPRVVTDTAGSIVWRWDSAESYGGSAPDQNPNNAGEFVYNQRFPGQVFDAESGLYQNWRREYNPRIGRYMESDPIGLRGGMNTYEYVNGAPTMGVDPKGEYLSGMEGEFRTYVDRMIDVYTTAVGWILPTVASAYVTPAVAGGVGVAGAAAIDGLPPGRQVDGTAVVAGGLVGYTSGGLSNFLPTKYGPYVTWALQWALRQPMFTASQYAQQYVQCPDKDFDHQKAIVGATTSAIFMSRFNSNTTAKFGNAAYPYFGKLSQQLTKGGEALTPGLAAAAQVTTVNSVARSTSWVENMIIDAATAPPASRPMPANPWQLPGFGNSIGD